MALFPAEVDTDQFTVGSKRVFGGPDDWSMPIFYDGLPMQLQTPWLRNVFGMNSYTNPGGKTSYSLSFQLSDTGDDAQFTAFLTGLDDHFKDLVPVEANYHSSVRPCTKLDESGHPKYPPTFRVKLKAKFDKFDCDLMQNQESKKWTINEAMNGKGGINHGDQCRLILELLPVWSAGGRWGTSWKALSIQVLKKEGFRNMGDPPPFAKTFAASVPSPSLAISSVSRPSLP